MNNNIGKREALDANNAKDVREEHEVYEIIGGYSDYFDAEGYPEDAQINVVKKIKMGPFLITVQRRR